MAFYLRLRDERNRSSIWIRIFNTSKCFYIIQVEFFYILSAVDGTNLLYSLYDISGTHQGWEVEKTWILETYDSKYFIGTYFPSTELTCALIINIFIFSFCQLTAKRSGTAFDRCCKNAVNLRSYLDIVIWIALSDLRKISYEHI